MRFPETTMLLVAISVFTACRPDTTAPARKPALARTDVALQVLVAGDRRWATALGQLRGEWAELSQGSFEIQEISPDDLLRERPPEGDVVVFASRYLGALCEQKQIRPVRSSVLESGAFDLSDLLPVIRNHQMRYDGQVMALPLGTPVPALLLRNDLLTGGCTSVETWAQLVDCLSAAPGDEPLRAALLDLEGLGAACALLWHSAAYAQHVNRPATLFDPETMRPRIHTPAFVRGLEELCAAHQHGSDAGSSGGADRAPAALRAVSLAGDGREILPPGLAPHVSVVPLPGAQQVYNPDADRWEEVPGDVKRVTVLCGEGVLVSVTTASRNAPAAFRLAGWLTGRAEAASSAAPLFGLCRQSQQSSFRPLGSDPTLAALNRETAQIAATTLAAPRWLSVPRIPGVDAYLQALAEEVRRAAAGEVTVEEALAEVESRWEAITDRHGRAAQASAYRSSLNLL